jgi:SAM-dependent methyltransferase
MTSNCHICASKNIRRLEKFDEIWRVTSDCNPFQQGGQIAFCQSCKTLVTLVDSSLLEANNQLYSIYAPYQQHGGIEEKVFVGSEQSSRSQKILDSVFLFLVKPQTPKRWLDIGCGRGDFLYTLSSLFPEITSAGVDLSAHFAQTVESIPNVEFHTTSLDDSRLRRFDFVSLIHVLEHIENPREFLSSLKRFMNESAQLIIQVPNLMSNPYALVISDHVTHFDSTSLFRLLEISGFQVQFLDIDFIPGEITLVAKPESANGINDENFYVRNISHGLMRTSRQSDWGGATLLNYSDALVDSLIRTSSWLKDCRHRYSSFGIFGTSIAGTWAGLEIGMQHDFWFDEAPLSLEAEWQGKPVVRPSQIVEGGVVALTLADAKIENLRGRYHGSEFRFEMPPTYRYLCEN